MGPLLEPFNINFMTRNVEIVDRGSADHLRDGGAVL